MTGLCDFFQLKQVEEVLQLYQRNSVITDFMKSLKCLEKDLWIIKVDQDKSLRMEDYMNEQMNGQTKVRTHERVSWKQRPLRPLRPPKTPKLENKDPPYFSGLRNYDKSVANATVSWALVTRILASQTDIRGIGFVLNRKTLCFVSSKEPTPCLFEVFNFHRK